ncbi:DNA ligase 3 [Copidosoma floridanum]|uniref:DNA ligase 3 n=1 Tax=Copidosoma floridanum TaxID=29053 RepID=UPI0006C9B7B1|nr:DNA ligase 3 [Copidosoma floridanum]
MSDEEVAEEKPFEVERAKSGRAKCKKCKCPIDKDQVRIAKLMANPFGEGKMKAWHHVSCIFEVFTKQRATTKRIENPQEDIGGWDALCDADKNLILEKLADFENAEPFKAAKAKATAKSPKTNQSNKTSKNDSSVKATTSTDEQKQSANVDTTKKTKFTRDNTFLEFQSICDQVSSCSAYLEKTAIVKKMFTKGSSGGKCVYHIFLFC